MTEDELPDWDRIVEQHAKRVFQVAMRILRSVQDAEDISQDVFTEAFRLHSKGLVQSWTGLLVRLATLRSLDRLRRNRPFVELRDDDKPSTIGPSEEAGARELADWLRKAIAQLSDQQATVFVMHYFEQLSHDQISATLGVSSDAVSTALCKARATLAHEVGLLQSGTLQMNDEYRFPDFDSLEPPLETAVKVALGEPIPEDAIDRVKARAKVLAATTVLPSHAPGSRHRSRMASRLLEGVQANTTRPIFPTRSLTTWRWIVRSRAFRLSAAAVLMLVIGGIAFWLHGIGATPAFADFIKPILDAKTITYKETWYEGGQKMTGREMGIASPQRWRSEEEVSGKIKSVTISDDTGKQLALRPAKKVAILTSYIRASEEKGPKPILFELQSQLADARDRPDWIRESLGEKEIDGRRLIGYRLTGHGLICDLWGDPKTGMPVRFERSAPSSPNLKPVVCTDFVFNADLDESLFSLEPPPGYKVEKRTHVILPPAQEKDLIETFRRYGELCGGALPDQLDCDEFARLYDEDWEKSHPMKGRSPSEEERQESLNGLKKLTRGVSFAFERLPREADAHYAGKGIKLGAADTPIFWYRPKDAKKYRIIYADLSVREADRAPSVPNAQPIVSVSGPKK